MNKPKGSPDGFAILLVLALLLMCVSSGPAVIGAGVKEAKKMSGIVWARILAFLTLTGLILASYKYHWAQWTTISCSVVLILLVGIWLGLAIGSKVIGNNSNG
jgi:hypothetical protein